MCGENESYDGDADGKLLENIQLHPTETIDLSKGRELLFENAFDGFGAVNCGWKWAWIALPSPLGPSEYDERKRNEHKTPAIDDVQNAEKTSKNGSERLDE